MKENFKHLARKVTLPALDIGEEAIKVANEVANEVISETSSLLNKDGEIKQGYGIANGIFSLCLAILCFLGVIAFHFPEYLTTPELRNVYNTADIRQIMFFSLLFAGSWSFSNIILNRKININSSAFIFVMITVALGGSRVHVGDYNHENAYYLGLDWFILDLLGSSIIFCGFRKNVPAV
ncbi:MAG: hypothetical protein RL571_196 [Pseudomonadota bacterium]|jgi:O-antigen/teichoic acid export membrane protein